MTDNNEGAELHSDAISTRLLNILAPNSSHSTSQLAEQLNVSQPEIVACIAQLNELGLDLSSEDDSVVRLKEPLKLLDNAAICECLTSPHDATILVKNIVSSTNDVIKTNMQSLSQGSVCIAEAQTQGRGRRGKKWVSPFGASIYLSMLWRFSKGYKSIEGLSLLVGLAVNQALKKIGIADCRLKWPNDVYHQNKKLAGILIEVEGHKAEHTIATIGIGVNFKLPKNLTSIDQAFTDVSTILNQDVDRNRFVAYLLDQLWAMIPVFANNGLKPFVQLWQSSDLYLNKPVTLLVGTGKVTGVCRGINESGALLLETAQGIETFYGGEISVRPA